MPPLRTIFCLFLGLMSAPGCTDIEEIEDDIEDEIEDKCEDEFESKGLIKQCIRDLEDIVEPAIEFEPEETLEIVEDWDYEDGVEELGEDLIDMLED